MWLTSPLLRAPHGFSTARAGNFDDREDDPAEVALNRSRGLDALGLSNRLVARLSQVHGADVRRAAPGVQEGDALVSDDPRFVLTIMTADCYPLLFEDAEAGVVGAAHAGWRGTISRIAERTIEAMEILGARRERLLAAVGPGICGERYEVGDEVARRFEAEGLGEAVATRKGLHLDLLRANLIGLADAGLTPAQTWAANRCTTEPDFFSYRRDAGKTGRMWSVISISEPIPSRLASSDELK